MKSIIIILILVFSIAVQSRSQVSVSGAVVGNGSYSTLADAFAAINGGVQTGASISIIITSSTLEPVTGAVLNAGAWSGISIQPSGGGDRVISGAVNAGLTMIDINGADNVIIDGLNTEGNSLTISNSTVSSTAGTSTIRFQSDATNNKVMRCSILGSSLTSVGTTGGTIWIGANSTSTGNDNNVISECNIGPAGANLPSKCVFISGTTTASRTNSNDTIKNCNIHDYFNPASASSGVYIGSGSTDIGIVGNKLFQSSERVLTSNSLHSAIYITNTSGNNFWVAGNTIGYSNQSGTGTYSIAGASNIFKAIYMNVGSTASSGIQDNLITSISHSSNGAGTGISSPSTIVYIDNGLVNISGNTIGSLSSTSSITYSAANTGNSQFIGIASYGLANFVCNDNSIGGILVSNTSTGSNSFSAITVNNSASNIATCQNNLIGGSVLNSIQSTSSSNSSKVNGIFIEDAVSEISGNVISNLSASGGTGTSSLASVTGIVVNATSSAGHDIHQNEIHTLTNSHSSTAVSVTGLYLGVLSGTNHVSSNFIHSLMVSNSSATINGIVLNVGTADVTNNMVQLGIDPSGNNLNIGCSLNGIYESNEGHNLYHNSIFIGGSPTGGNSNSYALNSVVGTYSRIYKNNIFYNSRSNNGSTGTHFSLKYGGTTFNPTGLSSNSNVLLSDGVGSKLGYFNAVAYSDIGAWQTAVGEDFNSLSYDPHFIEPDGNSLSVNLHIDSATPSIIETNGSEITSVTVDFDGESRNILTPHDVGADAGNFIRIIPYTPVSVSGALDNNGNFATLSAAFAAINAAVQTNSIINIAVNGNTSEPPSGAILFQGSWQNIFITPTGNVTISGNSDAGIPLIKFDGADNVTIDGLNSNGNALRVLNTSTSSVSGTSTILLQNDASSNRITNCELFGSSTVSFAGDNNGGVISFGKSQGMVTGNDNNSISNCSIGPVGSNYPNKCISFKGTTTAPTLNNSGDSIINCTIYDFFNDSAQSGGIYVGTGNQNIVFKNNKFFQTTPRTFSTYTFHSAIWIDSRNGTSNGFDISGNLIGYSSAVDSGYYSIESINGLRFYGIYTSTDDILPATSIQNNRISNILMSGELFGILDEHIPFVAVYADGGLVRIGDEIGNTIGDLNDTNSIILNSSSTGNSGVNLIHCSGASDLSCSNNNIGGIALTNSSGAAFFLSCIRSKISSTKTFTCENNVIGGQSRNSIRNYTEYLYYAKIGGIIVSTSGSVIRDNRVSNMITSSTGRNDPASVIGISIDASSSSHLITGNDIHSLSNTHLLLSQSSDVTGIYFNATSGSNIVERNHIHNLIAENQQSIVRGMDIKNGTTTYKNNMIQLGSRPDGTNLETGAEIYGIEETGGSNIFCFNSIYIGGEPNGGSGNTYALLSTVLNNTRDYKNNICYNSRSNYGSIGKHYALQVGGTIPNPAGLNMNYNVYFVDGSGGLLGRFNNIDIVDLIAWKSAVGQDSNSYFDNPHFIDPDGSDSDANLHINSSFPTVIDGNGLDIPSITDDFDGDFRSSFTPVDIGADAGDFPAYFSNDLKVESGSIQNQVIITGNTYDLYATIRNVGSNAQSSTPIYYTVNNGSPVGPVFISGTVYHLETQIVTFNDTMGYSPVSEGNVLIKIYSAMVADENRNNDTVTLNIQVYDKIYSFPFVETFSNLSNWSVTYENPIYETVLWELGLCTNPAGDLSNIAATSNCYLGATGRREILKSPPIDLSVGTNVHGSNIPVLDFYVSYSGYSGLDDSLEVLLSTDNGNSFFNAAVVYNKSQTSEPSLATRPVQYTEFFPDSSVQWRHEQISLENVAGDSNVILGFRSKSDFGNRQWIDNVIISEASSITSTAVNSAGTYSFDDVTVQVTSVSIDSFDKSILSNDRHSDIVKTPPNRSRIVSSIPGANGNPNLLRSESVDNTTGGVLTLTKYPFQDPVPSFATPSISENDINTGAITGDSSRFTPDFVNPDIYFTVSYSGNDYNGYAEYNIRIDVSDLTSISDLNKVYIMKRADLTDQWECLNTTVSGDTLIAEGLNTFSDFALGQSAEQSITLELELFIEGFYSSLSNLQVSDTISVMLKSIVSPYSTIDSAKTIMDSSGVATVTFDVAASGTYYLALKHRNAVETWSANGIAMTVGNTASYSFASAAVQAYGNNLAQVDTAPIRFALFSGDVDGDGAVDATDLSLIDNDAFNFSSGYLDTDIDGNNFVDGSDYSFADNNSLNFVGKITPEFLK